MKCYLFAVLFGLFILVPSTPVLGQTEIDFKKQVAPILKKHCAACHNSDDYEAGFSVDSYDELEEGSDGEAVFEAGDADESWMIQLMTGEKEPMMPPDDQPRPTAEEIKTLKTWINQGAKDSVDAEQPDDMNPVELPPADLGGAVTATAWSDKNVIAIGRYQSVELIDGETMKSLAVLPQSGKVNSLDFSTDGSKLLVAGGKVGQGGVATLWEVAKQIKLFRITGHRDAIYSAVLSPNEKFIATASYDKQIRIWDGKTGEPLAERRGHTGAVFDLAFSHDSRNLISASADQTIKVWSMTTGERLDTLGQPLEGQLTAAFSRHPGNQLIVSGGMDKRIWIWKFVSRERAELNPLMDSRFAHEGPIVQLEFTPDGKRLISCSEDRTLKVWSAEDFRQLATFQQQSDFVGAFAISPGSDKVIVGRMNGGLETIDLSAIEESKSEPASKTTVIETNQGTLERTFSKLEEAEPNDEIAGANALTIPAYANGSIYSTDSDSDIDLFKFTAQKGRRLLIETRAARDQSKADTRLQILDSHGMPVPQVTLRAVRESYFTFRGKNSDTADDFRIHNWEEMQLNEFLYCNGEVVRLFQHPRGPDSGFLVYPGEGKRQGYFGTTATSHALHETCYVVRPFPPGTKFPSNGLPIFELNYENDDAATRKLGRDSQISFLPPEDGEYFVKVTDARGFHGSDFNYRLEIRGIRPDFKVDIGNEDQINPGSGRQFSTYVHRLDGFEGPVTVDIQGLPKDFRVTRPLKIEAGHVRARGTIWLPKVHEPFDDFDWSQVKVTARAQIGGGEVTREVSGFKPIKVSGSPKVEVRIVSLDTPEANAFDDTEPLVLTVRPGESIQAKVVVKRNAHNGRVSFGQAGAGQNLPHGVYVDDIGLNGLMVIAGRNEQNFFITADPWVQPQERLFYLRANDVGGQVTLPVLLKVVK